MVNSWNMLQVRLYETIVSDMKLNVSYAALSSPSAFPQVPRQEQMFVRLLHMNFMFKFYSQAVDFFLTVEKLFKVRQVSGVSHWSTDYLV
jgi:hypothetical protein